MRVNVFFEGGGILGLSLIGAYKALTDKGIYIDKALGISSGAIIASLIISGYSANELLSLLSIIEDFSFLKKKTVVAHKNVIGKTLSILIKKGIYDSVIIEKFMRLLLKKKGVKRFQDVIFAGESRLKIIAYDVTIKKMLILPDDLKYYGYDHLNFKISKAVRMSCAIPLFYTPYVIEGLDCNHFIVDGGVAKNIPTSIIKEDNKLTLRFKIQNYKKNLQQPDDKIIIPIHHKIKSTDFNINREQILYLVNQGYKATYKYIRKIMT